jgi:hypothetical protein
VAKDFNVEQAAHLMMAGGAVEGKLSRTNLLSMLHVLAGWVRSANLRAKTAEAEAQALNKRLGAYEAELAHWQKESDEQFDGFNAELNQKNDEIERLTKQLGAAINVINRRGAVAEAVERLVIARACATEAEIRLVALGAEVSFTEK